VSKKLSERLREIAEGTKRVEKVAFGSDKASHELFELSDRAEEIEVLLDAVTGEGSVGVRAAWKEGEVALQFSYGKSLLMSPEQATDLGNAFITAARSAAAYLEKKAKNAPN
jgi:hypothetical protein